MSEPKTDGTLDREIEGEEPRQIAPLRIRPGVSLHVYTSAGQSFPFIVDEATKYARRISNADAALFRQAIGEAPPDGAAEQSLSEDELERAGTAFRELGFLDEGLGRQEVTAALQARWRRENHEALGETLAYAAATMPMYDGRIPRSGDSQALTRIPILSRLELRNAFPAGYARDQSTIVKGIQSGAFSVIESSGTTSDERSRVLSDNRRSEISTANARFINRVLWPGADQRHATFTTLHCAGLVCARDMPQMELRTGQILTLLPPEDPTAPTTEEITRTLREIRVYGANLLRVHPVYLAHVTWGALDRGLELPRVRAIVTTFEFRSKIHARLLSEAWKCPVYAEYSVSEIRGLPMVECERHVYHVNDRFYRLEALRDGKPALPGQVGRLVATTLRGRLPLVRYDTGDLVIAHDGPAACECGALHSILGRIAGRARDALSAPDGRLLSTAEVDDVVSTVDGVRFYQLVRESPREYTLAIARDPNASPATIEQAAHAAVRPLLGDAAAVRVKFVPAVFPERSGKFRLTVSKVPETTIRAEGSPDVAPVAFAPLA